MAPTSTTTIHDAKATFIRTQVRLLSTPLQPSPSWHDDTPAAATTANSTATAPPPPPLLPSKTLDQALRKVNAHLQTHNRSLFSAPTQRHVAAQLDTLYWNDAKDALNNAQARGTVVVRRHVDLREREGVEGLPEGGMGELFIDPDAGDEDGDDEEEEEYTALRARLASSMDKRDAQRRRLEQYKTLRGMLGPFERPKENVQPNLVTRDGEMARELERMRVLIARVVAGVGRVDDGVLLPAAREEEGGDGFGVEEDVDVDGEGWNERKVLDAMDLT